MVAAKRGVIRTGLVAAAGLGFALARRRGAELRAQRARADRAVERADAAERALVEHTREAERSNRDLEQFAYVASHELSEPLRTVSSFVALLADRYDGRLGDDADEFIRHAVDGTQRMQRLIGDLLQYARVGRAELVPRAVDLDDVVRESLASLHGALEESGAEVEVGPLPVVHGDRAQLGQVFQNLLSNALKFSDGLPPRVRVTAQRAGAAWELAVVDDGIGVDAAARERIFEMFQRLNSRDAYDGTGIGLAISRRIVERHGGRIWVEPAPDGAGSAFRFTLPAAMAGTTEPAGASGGRTGPAVTSS